MNWTRTPDGVSAPLLPASMEESARTLRWLTGAIVALALMESAGWLICARLWWLFS